MTFFSKLFGNNIDNKKELNFLLNNESFKKFLDEAEDISIGYSEINFFKIDNLENAQIGYSIDEKGKSLIGKNTGDWKKSWIVIATDNLGDPIFIDCENSSLPVFSSPDGQGNWEETYIAISLDNFREILKDLKNLSIGKENPVKIEKNPISKIELDSFLEKTKNENNWMDVEFWEIFLENDDE